MSVIGPGMASSQVGKVAAYGELSRLTQLLARQAPWVKLNEQVTTKVVQRFAAKFVQRLTKKKLGQFVPVAGIAVGAGLNYLVLDQTAAGPSLGSARPGDSLGSLRQRRARPTRDFDLPVHVAGCAGSVSSGCAVDEQRILFASLPEVNEHMQRVHAQCGRSDVHIRVVLEHRQRQHHRFLAGAFCEHDALAVAHHLGVGVVGEGRTGHRE